jgi:hypothetical protein
MRSAFHQAAKAHFRVTKLMLDHSKRMLDLGFELGFRILDFACFLYELGRSAIDQIIVRF